MAQHGCWPGINKGRATRGPQACSVSSGNLHSRNALSPAALQVTSSLTKTTAIPDLACRVRIAEGRVQEDIPQTAAADVDRLVGHLQPQKPSAAATHSRW